MKKSLKIQPSNNGQGDNIVTLKGLPTSNLFYIKILIYYSICPVEHKICQTQIFTLPGTCISAMIRHLFDTIIVTSEQIVAVLAIKVSELQCVANCCEPPSCYRI